MALAAAQRRSGRVAESARRPCWGVVERLAGSEWSSMLEPWSRRSGDRGTDVMLIPGDTARE